MGRAAALEKSQGTVSSGHEPAKRSSLLFLIRDVAGIPLWRGAFFILPALLFFFFLFLLCQFFLAFIK